MAKPLKPRRYYPPRPPYSVDPPTGPKESLWIKFWVFFLCCISLISIFFPYYELFHNHLPYVLDGFVAAYYGWKYAYLKDKFTKGEIASRHTFIDKIFVLVPLGGPMLFLLSVVFMPSCVDTTGYYYSEGVLWGKVACTFVVEVIVVIGVEVLFYKLVKLEYSG